MGVGPSRRWGRGSPTPVPAEEEHDQEEQQEEEEADGGIMEICGGNGRAKGVISREG